MAIFFFLSHLYFTTLPPIGPSMCLKRDVFRAFTSTLSDVKLAYLQMAQWGTWQLHLRQQLPHFAEFCNILLYILYTFTVSRGLRRKGSLPFLTFRILYSWPNSDMYVWLCAFYNPFLAAFLASRSRYICGQKRLNCAINRLFWRSGGAHLAQSTFRPLTTGHWTNCAILFPSGVFIYIYI